jgi:transcriptional regulator with XRE-family HTH domain
MANTTRHKPPAVPTAKRARVPSRSGGAAAPAPSPRRRAQPTAPAAERAPIDLQVGARLKHARQLAGIRMRELAAKVGCTEGMISKIENARVMPSLPMLQRLVEALGRDLPSFFGSNPDVPGLVLRAGQRPIATTDPIRKGQGVHYERLVPFGAGNLLEGNIHVVAPDGSKHDPITHQGETMGYLLQGQLELTIEGTTYLLNAGDSFFFKNHLTNSYRNPGQQESRVLWVNTPQVH